MKVCIFTGDNQTYHIRKITGVSSNINNNTECASKTCECECDPACTIDFFHTSEQHWGNL